MLLLELVVQSVGVGIPLLPECLDEDIALPVQVELEEDISFLGRYDVDDLLLKPAPILGREILGSFFSLGAGWRRDDEGEKKAEEKNPFLFGGVERTK
jgi:hypothetical protein